MPFLALATDYDGTLAHHGRMDLPTTRALERLRESGRKLVLVTGRVLDELLEVCPRIELFDHVVAENGALLYRPETRAERTLGTRASIEFVKALRARGVDTISVGRVIIATWERYNEVVVDTIRNLGLDLQIILNKESLMVLPAGLNKAVGLAAALAELGISPDDTVGVGDAQNDRDFLDLCGFSVAVANALPSLKEHVDLVTRGERGEGVTELIDRLLAGKSEEPGIMEPR